MLVLKTALRDYREKANMEPGEISNMLGIEEDVINFIERGCYNPSLKLVLDLAQFFDLSVDELFWFEEE